MKTKLYFNMFFFTGAEFFSINGRKVVDKFIRPAGVRFIATEDLRHIEIWVVSCKSGNNLIANLVPRKGYNRFLNKTFLKVFCNEK